MIQGSIEWHRARLGNITASNISKLMGKGRSKDSVFSETAISYLNKLTAQRLLDKEVVADEELFRQFLDLTEGGSRATDWGNMYESEARLRYEQLHGCEVALEGMVAHLEVPHLCASPDGLVGDDGLVEIKCPQPEKFMRYCTGIASGKSLKELNPDYWWQIQCQLEVTGRSWCDWVVYHPWIAPTIKEMRIERDEDDIRTMLERVALAEAQINTNIDSLTNIEF